jgi:hypothetical protein
MLLNKLDRMIHKRANSLGLLMVLMVIPGIGQDCQHLEGLWSNDLESVLVIDSITADFQLLGEYRSSTGVDGRVFPLQGWVNQSLNDEDDGVMAIAFSVRWEGYGSITSWTGYCDFDEEGTFIKTLWHLIRPGEDIPWERVLSNSSTFRPYQRKH